MPRKPIPLAAPMVITITPNATQEIIESFPEFLDSNLIVRVSNQHYGENRV